MSGGYFLVESGDDFSRDTLLTCARPLAALATLMVLVERRRSYEVRSALREIRRVSSWDGRITYRRFGGNVVAEEYARVRRGDDQKEQMPAISDGFE